MKVQFRRTYFGPDGNRYRPGIEHEVPDSWEKQLPSSATVIEPEPKKKKASDPDEAHKSGGVTATASAAAGASSKGTKL